MSNTILLKRNGNAAAVPLAANLTLGELSLNYADGVLYFLNSGNVVTVLANANTASGTQLVNGTSNVVTRTSGNVTVSSAGTANVLTISSTGIYITGLSSVSGNITAGNLLTGGLISATSSVTAASVVGGVITGTSTSVTGAVSGASASVSGGVTAASVAGGVITGTSTSVTGTTTAASVVGGVITGSSTSVTGTTTAASVVGGVITGASLSTSGNITGGNILFGTGNVSGTGNITGGYFIGNGSQLTGVTAASFAPVMFNDVSTQTNGKTAVFALLTDQTAATGISNSKQLQVTVNGALVTPYINSWTWPFFTTYYGSYPGFRVTTLGYGLTANSVVIYNAPAVSSQVTITQINTSTDSQLRRYPYSATAIALGD